MEDDEEEKSMPFGGSRFEPRSAEKSIISSEGRAGKRPIKKTPKMESYSQ
jgi:hypothetical protein